MLQWLRTDILTGKSDACASSAGCPPISMTNFPRAFAEKFVDIWALAQIVKPSWHRCAKRCRSVATAQYQLCPQPTVR